MPNPGFPPLQPFHPATFLERGVAVPFTTPLMGGTRARPAERHGIDLVIPNPSGGRGAYVVPWTAIDDLCRPTLHDKILTTRISGLRIVTPATIRQVARAISLEGLAGEAATQAAKTADVSDKDSRVVTNYLLLLSLVEQVNLVFERSSAEEEGPEMEARAKMTTAWVAPRLGQSTAWVAAALESLADVFSNVGVGAARGSCRLTRIFNLLRQTSDEILAWSRELTDEEVGSYARMICIVADHTLTLSETVLTRAQDLTNDMVGLLRSWAADADRIGRIAARPDWMLDGWEPICLIWRCASDNASRCAAVAEIATLVPIMPREALDWCEMSLNADETLRFRRLVRLNEDWRTGTKVFDLIARNERMRAIAC